MIPMQMNSGKLHILVPREVDFDNVRRIRSLPPYDDMVIGFLDAWAKSLLSIPEAKQYPDIITFAFWCRKAHILNYKKAYDGKRDENSIRLGRGVVFHIAPSNVPINFAYSLAVGLLAGNANIVRVSSKDFQQVAILCGCLERLLTEKRFESLHGFITIVRYDREETPCTDFFSSFCDVRVIWGGDSTIAEIRKSLIPPRSFDVCFADRYSLCVINADELVKESDMTSVTQGFYNDTYLFDQNACTAPHLIVWFGTDGHKAKAKDDFWQAVTKIVDEQYQLNPVVAVDKLTAFCREAIARDGVKRESPINNKTIRLNVKAVDEDLESSRSVGGYFNEYDATELSELVPLINRKVQTLSFYGIDRHDLLQFVLENRLTGIDRIVPIGKTLDFDLVWDGFDLIKSLSRIVS